MADLTATDVTVAIVKRSSVQGMRLAIVDITFGNGAKTVPAGGVPMPAVKKFGVHREIYMMSLQLPLNGYVYKYDRTNHKLAMYQAGAATPTGTVSAPVFTGSALAAHNHNLLVKGSAAAGIDEALGVEGTDTLAKDAATDRTIVGADSATKGGVVGITGGTPAGTNSAPTFTGAAIAAAALAEFTGAPASAVVRAAVWGY